MEKMVIEGNDDDDGQSSEIKSTPTQKRKAREEDSSYTEDEQGQGEGSEEEEEEEEEGMDFDNFSGLFGIGDTIEIRDLLFPSPNDRNFLIRGPEQRQDVKLGDLHGKTIVLLVVPLQRKYLYSQVNFNVIDAYHELSPEQQAEVPFVFVAVRTQFSEQPPKPIPDHDEEEAYFQLLLDTIPFPTIPFNDKSARQGVFKAFNFHMNPILERRSMPYWCIIDSDSKLVSTRTCSDRLFRVCGGAELYPFTLERISKLRCHGCIPKLLLENLNELLELPSNDLLLKRDVEVPASSLPNKVIGLFFWVNTPSPTFKKLLKDVYDAAKDKGLDFEIVQSRFLLYPTSLTRERPNDQLEQESYDDVDWLRVPFKDPRHKKLLRVLCKAYHEDSYNSIPNFLVIVDKQTEGRVRYEISGAHILEQYGVDGHPFTRQALAHMEFQKQKESVTFQSLFPNVEIPARMQVLVLFAAHRDCKSTTTPTILFTHKLVAKLKAKYNKQVPDAKKFEVLYVSSDGAEDLFEECTRDMPWKVLPYSVELVRELRRGFFKANIHVQFATFDEKGVLMTKACCGKLFVEGQEFDDLEFPFSSSVDTESLILAELERKCCFDYYYDQQLEEEYLPYYYASLI